MTDEELIARLREIQGQAGLFASRAARRIEELVKVRREDALELIAAHGQAQDAYEAQLKAEARAERLEAALRKAEDDFYEAANRFQDEDYEGPHENFTVNVVCHVKPYFDMHMKHLRDSAEAARAALKGADHE